MKKAAQWCSSTMQYTSLPSTTFTMRLRANSCKETGKKRVKAFTLVELLVSTVVLLAITALAGHLLNDIARLMTSSGKTIDCDSQAQLIYTRIAGDIAAMNDSPDLHSYFKSQSGNDAFYFYSQVPGYPATETTPATGESLVGYRMSAIDSGRMEMERLARGLGWCEEASSSAGNAASLLYLPYRIDDAFSQVIQNPYNNSSNPNNGQGSGWDVIGKQVVRLEFCFLLKDGTFGAIPIANSANYKNNPNASTAPTASDDRSSGYTPGSRWYDTTKLIAYKCINASNGAAQWTPMGLEDVNAIVISLALIPSRSRTLLTGNNLASISEKFSDFTSSEPTANAWLQLVNDTGTMASSLGISVQAISSIRIYERFFYLNKNAWQVSAQ